MQTMALKWRNTIFYISLTIFVIISLSLIYTSNNLKKKHCIRKSQSSKDIQQKLDAVHATFASPVPRELLQKAMNYTIGEFNICSELKTDLFLLIYVHTAPYHFKHRSLIRRTFGNSIFYGSLKAVVVFFMGQTTINEVALGVKAESERYHDIIQSDYIDSYKNLSLKAISAFKWVNDNCQNATFILKVDDDVFVNIFDLVRLLKSQSVFNSTSINCLIWIGMSVDRNEYSKWFVSKDEYPLLLYPKYCSGGAYFMSWMVVSQLYDAVSRAPFLWVDDVYATGLLAKSAGVPHNPINPLIKFLMIGKNDQQFSLDKQLFVHVDGYKEVDLIYTFWRNILQREGYKSWL